MTFLEDGEIIGLTQFILMTRKRHGGIRWENIIGRAIVITRRLYTPIIVNTHLIMEAAALVVMGNVLKFPAL